MRTKYFRSMFHNVTEGVMYSVGIADSETRSCWTAYYLCAGEKTDASGFVMDERFFVCRETVRLVVAGDSSEATMHLLMDFVKENQVEQVVIPGSRDTTGRKLREAGVRRVVELEPGGFLSEEKDFWKFDIHCYGTKEGYFLTMFGGPVGIDWRTMDCLMSVKPFHSKLCCSSEIDIENHACCMKCSLYNDFDVCKGHNQNTGKGYTAGALLLGNVPVMKYIETIKRDYSGIREQIRYISMVEGVDQVNEEFIAWVGESRKELNHYYVLPSGCADTGAFIKRVLSESGRNRVYLTEKECGVCGSGFFTSRVLK
ncbi:MAG: hypothetical protein MRZ69_11275 [Lachnospiraceae bacterium]|nr:hypothetical protein [Lachnospiraceae bacterium]